MKSLKLALVLLLSVLSLTLFCACDNEQPQGTEVLTVTLSTKKIDFESPGQTHTLSATVAPENAEDKTVEWTTTDPAVAACDDGTVTSTGYGVCVIRATASNGVTATCIVAVGVSNREISLSESAIVFKELGEKTVLIPSTNNGNVLAEDVLWLSSNSSIASCTDGEVVAVGYGVCTITARAKNGTMAQCTVVVEEPNNAYCYISETALTLDGIDQRHTLNATVSSDAAIKISWVSSNESIATVSDGVVSSTGYGTCAIIAVAENGLSAACILTVGEETRVENEFEDLLKFEVLGIPSVTKHVNRDTGQVESVAMVIDRKITVVDNKEVPELSAGELGVIVELKCVKIYDVNGLDGQKSVAITASTYREEDGESIFCTSQILREPECSIGNEFTRTILVRVMSNPDQQRYFYITISEYTIL